jgi:hypothetical protein
LHHALKILGYRSVHYPCYTWIAERYEAACDLPIPLLYKELDRKHPRSKFVLTVREPEDWARSIIDHRRRHPLGAGWLAPGPVREAIRVLLGGPEAEPERLCRAYRAHVAAVRAYFGDNDRLLTLDICAGDGWSKLCPFLDTTIPRVPFPRTNAGRADGDSDDGTSRRAPARVC